MVLKISGKITMHLKLCENRIWKCSDKLSSNKTSVKVTSEWQCSTSFLKLWTVAGPGGSYSILYSAFNDAHCSTVLIIHSAPIILVDILISEHILIFLLGISQVRNFLFHSTVIYLTLWLFSLTNQISRKTCSTRNICFICNNVHLSQTSISESMYLC